jgi:hypothetical protein
MRATLRVSNFACTMRLCLWNILSMLTHRRWTLNEWCAQRVSVIVEQERVASIITRVGLLPLDRAISLSRLRRWFNTASPWLTKTQTPLAVFTSILARDILPSALYVYRINYTDTRWARHFFHRLRAIFAKNLLPCLSLVDLPPLRPIFTGSIFFMS